MRNDTTRTALAGALALSLALLLLLSAAAAARDGPTEGQVRWKRLSQGGDYFLNYDGEEPNAEPLDRDWPIGMVFYDEASVDRVKTFYGEHGFTREGGYMWLPYIEPRRGIPLNRQTRRYDRDKGKKTACVSSQNDHFRVYGPNGTDRFNDPRYGYFVVATAHIDHGDGDGACAGERYFGFSEDVENRLAVIADGSYAVYEDAKPLGNHERYRPDGNHFWSNGGRATTVRMP